MAKAPLAPVAPEAMELLFFYPCPFCHKHVPLLNPTQPAMVACDGCGKGFPILPVDEHTIQYVQIMLAGGKAAVDPDFV